MSQISPTVQTLTELICQKSELSLDPITTFITETYAERGNRQQFDVAYGILKDSKSIKSTFGGAVYSAASMVRHTRTCA